MTDAITLPSSVAKRTLEALTSYCNTGEIDGADDILASLLFELDQPPVKQEPIRWPANASEVRAFLSGHVAAERCARDDHQPDDNDTYTLSANDLLGAIYWWTDFDPQPPRQPLTDEQMARAWAVASGEHNASSSVKRRITRAIERAHGIGGEA